MKRSTVIISVVSGLVFLGFFILVYTLTNKPVQTDFPNVAKVSASDHVKWSQAKKNVLVEYGDFQCPACQQFYQIIAGFEAKGSANADITQKVAFVYRHFPLPSHPNAIPAAYAAESAGKQDKFWQMYDLLYLKQKEWSSLGNPTDYFVKLATELKLDIDKFKVDMNSSEVKTKVEADQRSGSNVEVDSTPTFYFNGKKIDVQSIDQFVETLRSGSN